MKAPPFLTEPARAGQVGELEASVTRGTHGSQGLGRSGDRSLSFLFAHPTRHLTCMCFAHICNPPNCHSVELRYGLVPAKITAFVRLPAGAAPYSRRFGTSKNAIPTSVVPGNSHGAPPNVTL